MLSVAPISNTASCTPASSETLSQGHCNTEYCMPMPAGSRDWKHRQLRGPASEWSSHTLHRGCRPWCWLSTPNTKEGHGIDGTSMPCPCSLEQEAIQLARLSGT